MRENREGTTERRSLEKRLHDALDWLATEPTREAWLRQRSGWDSAVARKYRIRMPESMRSFAVWQREQEKRREALKRFLDTWIAAGCKFEEWQRANRDLYGWLVMAMKGRFTTLEPVEGGPARLMWVRPNLPGYLDSATWPACENFISLATSEFYNSVCKCHRCGNFYLNTTRRHRKVYCSRRCGSVASAKESMKRRRQRERQEKIARVEGALSAWRGRQTASRGDWKTWVSKRAGVTPKWLTRAVNRGGVQAPLEIRRESDGNL